MNKRTILMTVICVIFLLTFYPLLNAVLTGAIPNRPWVKSRIDFDYRLYDVDTSKVVERSGVREEDRALLMGNILSKESSRVTFKEIFLIMFFMGGNIREGLHATLHINRVGDDFPVSSVKGAHVKVKQNGIVILDKEMIAQKGPIYTLEPDGKTVLEDGRIEIPLDQYLLGPEISVEIILDGYSSWRVSYLSNINYIDLNEVKPVIHLIPFGGYVLYGVFIVEMVVLFGMLVRLRRWLRHSS